MKTLLPLFVLLISTSLFGEIIDFNTVDYRTGAKITPDRITVTNYLTGSVYYFHNTSKIDTKVFTGVEETDLGSSTLKVYPNPVSERCIIEIFSRNQKTDILTISNSLGQAQQIKVLLEQGRNIYELSGHNLAIGNYFIFTSESSSVISVLSQGQSSILKLEKVSDNTSKYGNTIALQEENLFSILIEKKDYLDFQIKKTDLKNLDDKTKLVNYEDLDFEVVSVLTSNIVAEVVRVVKNEQGEDTEELLERNLICNSVKELYDPIRYDNGTRQIISFFYETDLNDDMYTYQLTGEFFLPIENLQIENDGTFTIIYNDEDLARDVFNLQLFLFEENNSVYLRDFHIIFGMGDSIILEGKIKN